MHEYTLKKKAYHIVKIAYHMIMWYRDEYYIMHTRFSMLPTMAYNITYGM